MSRMTDEQAALEAAREWWRNRLESYHRQAAFVLRQRADAVEQARPAIERAARVDALESVVDECYDTEQHVREIIKAEIAKLEVANARTD